MFKKYDKNDTLNERTSVNLADLSPFYPTFCTHTFTTTEI